MKKLLPITFCCCLSAAAGAQDPQHDALPQLAAANPRTTTNRPLAEDGAQTLGAILFRTDSAEVEQALWPVMRAAAALATHRPELVIELAGYADVRGSRNHNRALSARRVESVATFLIRNGISPDRIRRRVFGESRAQANVNDGGGHIFDRRVTITLYTPDVSA
jgi:outer membrane protein OmpA-like peptidoglycan-associated protein